MTENNGRDGLGRFAPGSAGGPGRPRDSITRQLRRQCDPAAVAAFLLGVVSDPAAAFTAKERIRAAEVILDRLEGRAVKRSLALKLTAATLLPSGYEFMDPLEKSRTLDQLRERALAGELPTQDDEHDDVE